MDITAHFVLPDDVILTPGQELPQGVRKNTTCGDDDFVITRPHARSASQIVDKHGAALLEMFRSPSAIVDAVINYSRKRELDPQAMLVEAYPMLQGMMDARFLVGADSRDAETIGPSLDPGDEVMRRSITRVVEVSEDVEVYQVRAGRQVDRCEVAALKMMRLGSELSSRRKFEREAAVLRHLNGEIGPALLEAGLYEDRPYLLMEWCHGVNASQAAAELRRQDDAAGILSLCVKIADSYTSLHARGVVHGDIHPRNILVSGDGAVRLVDFGLAQLEDGGGVDSWQETGGVAFFLEPEYIDALRSGRVPPLRTCAGEQYALGTLIYLLVTGVHYIDFSLEREEMLRQIVSEETLAFSEQGVASWPEVEGALRRALRKNPKERHASVAEFGQELKNALGRTRVALENGSGRKIPERPPRARFLHETLKHVEPRNALFAAGIATAPTCSVKVGAAGIAYALYRAACISGDAKLLADADLWITKAFSDCRRTDAFSNPGIEVTTETVGRISPYHCLSGLYAVQALISHAMGDAEAQQGAVDAFVAASEQPCENVDLALGHSGTLLASSLLLEALGGDELRGRDSLLALGNGAMDRVQRELGARTPIDIQSPSECLGVAHGWAGCLYAMLRWCECTGKAVPDMAHERLQELAACAEPLGRGARWKWGARGAGHSQYMAGWCHGSAGYVFLWNKAYDAFREETFLVLGEKAAWNAWEAPQGINPDLCCGLAGRAYGFLNMYKRSGRQEWRHRASDFARAAADIGSLPGCPQERLYKGTLGVALLIMDLEQPEISAMPFFEREYG